MLSLSFPSQGPKASSWRVLSALCMWSTHQQGRSSPWAVGCAEMPTPSKQHRTFTENQFVYCDFWLLLKLSREVWLLHCQVSWKLDQVTALRQESSGLLFYQHPYPGSAPNTSCGSFGFRVTWMEKKNNRNLKKKKKKENNLWRVCMRPLYSLGFYRRCTPPDHWSVTIHWIWNKFA